jgi:cobalt/nickel transport system ATP-binding protein
MLNIENLTVTYPDGTVAVDHLSMNAAEGEHIALIGANGAGKTSLMLAIEGVLPSEGTICVDGTTLSKQTIPEIRQKAGLVFQNPDDQLFMPTIYDDIAFGPRNAGMDEESVRYRVEDRLRLLGIESLKDKTALKLSGGEKRMAAFLDPKARRKLIGILKKLPHTMLISTHDLAFALEICPRSILLKDGMIFADAPSKKLLYDRKQMEEGGVESIGVTGGIS